MMEARGGHAEGRPGPGRDRERGGTERSPEVGLQRGRGGAEDGPGGGSSPPPPELGGKAGPGTGGELR